MEKSKLLLRRINGGVVWCGVVWYSVGVVGVSSSNQFECWPVQPARARCMQDSEAQQLSRLKVKHGVWGSDNLVTSNGPT